MLNVSLAYRSLCTHRMNIEIRYYMSMATANNKTRQPAIFSTLGSLTAGDATLGQVK
jgi:hypothetical protein